MGTLADLKAELDRVGAEAVTLEIDNDFEPEAGTLVRIERTGAYWHMLPEHLLNLLAELPDEAGDDAVHQAIEREGPAVWHGPAPEGSRDTPV